MNDKFILAKASEILESYSAYLAKELLKIAVIIPPAPENYQDIDTKDIATRIEEFDKNKSEEMFKLLHTAFKFPIGKWNLEEYAKMFEKLGKSEKPVTYFIYKPQVDAAYTALWKAYSYLIDGANLPYIKGNLNNAMIDKAEWTINAVIPYAEYIKTPEEIEQERKRKELERLRLEELEAMKPSHERITLLDNKDLSNQNVTPLPAVSPVEDTIETKIDMNR